jgi:osmoprotectant transport system permease protein
MSERPNMRHCIELALVILVLVASPITCPLPAKAATGANSDTSATEGDGSAPDGQASVTVGSKKFTENVILGEILTQLAGNAGIPARHRRELGGTRVLWNALVGGDIDVYPEYTGTIQREILKQYDLDTVQELREKLGEFGIRMSPPLGFNNTYAIGMKEDVAESLKIATISDLRNHPDLKFGFTNEFMDREDGWQGLRAHYGLPQNFVRGLDHDLAYRGIDSESIHVVDLYSTDAEIEYYRLRALEDDLGYFPEYDAVLLLREDLIGRAPGLVERLESLAGAIPESRMIAMNARAKLEGVHETEIAAGFIREAFGFETSYDRYGFWRRLGRHTADHLILVAISLSAAILIAIPLGIIAAKYRRLEKPIMGVAGIIQTIPSLALLVFMIPLLGIGGPPAVTALFLYSLLPIVRNTFTGIRDIPPSIRESARALGLPPAARLRLVELPMASSTILAGIKTSAVINIGTATLGALIGAGGYGQPILTGIRLDDITMILQGAVPAALLALIVQGLFDFAERFVVPKGLRLS